MLFIDSLREHAGDVVSRFGPANIRFPGSRLVWTNPSVEAHSFRSDDHRPCNAQLGLSTSES